MMTVDELIQKVNTPGHGCREDYEYWLEVEKEVEAFLSGNASQKDKEKLRRKAYLEMLYMICQGIRWEREQKAP